jgi:hypothetical protein
MLTVKYSGAESQGWGGRDAAVGGRPNPGSEQVQGRKTRLKTVVRVNLEIAHSGVYANQ